MRNLGLLNREQIHNAIESGMLHWHHKKKIRNFGKKCYREVIDWLNLPEHFCGNNEGRGKNKIHRPINLPLTTAKAQQLLLVLKNCNQSEISRKTGVAHQKFAVAIKYATRMLERSLADL